MPYPRTGSTESGLLRPSVWADRSDLLTAYLVTDAALPRAVLAGVDIYIYGRSDLRTFYCDTEPWIAEAAVTVRDTSIAGRLLGAAAAPDAVLPGRTPCRAAPSTDS